MSSPFRFLFGLQIVVVLPFLLGGAQAGDGVRHIKFEVLLNGVVILTSATSDDGHADADEVWSMLNTQLFAPTKDFAQAVSDDVAVGEKVQLRVESKEKLIVRVKYGGEARTAILTIVRKQVTRRNRQWLLEGSDVKRMFRSRLISRRQAAALKNPSMAK